MYFWILKSIAGALLGSASSKWFSKTKLGHWCYEKFESLMDWAKDRYGINLLDKEDIEWKTKFPSVAASFDKLQKRVKKLEKNSHPAREITEFDSWKEIDERIKKLENRK